MKYLLCSMAFRVNCVILFFSFVMPYLSHIQVLSREQNHTNTVWQKDHQRVPSYTVDKARPGPQPQLSLLQQQQNFSLEASKWVSILGCGYWNITRYDTLTKTEENFNELFNGTFVKESDRFHCSLKCSLMLGVKYFLFHKTVCQCVANSPLNVDKGNLSCLIHCNNTAELYCYSGHGLPIFGFEQPQKVIQIPLNMLNHLHQSCLKEENGTYYKIHGKATCIGQLSDKNCSNINVVYRIRITTPSMFLQGLCGWKNGNNTKYFRILHRIWNIPTWNVSTTEQYSTTTSTVTVNDSCIHKGYSSSTPVVSVSSSTSSADNHGILIFNVVLLVVVVMILTAYGVLHVHSRIRNSSETKQMGSPNEQAIDVQRSSHYDTNGIESGSVGSDCTV